MPNSTSLTDKISKIAHIWRTSHINQDDYRKYATIAANAPAALTPEQAAVWTYPMNHDDGTSPVQLKEETVFNMVNAMLLRIHQSGHLARLDEVRLKLVQEGIETYKQIRPDLANGFPFWPIGLSSFSDEWSALGMKHENTLYLAVWRRNGNTPVKTLPIPSLTGKNINVRILYPSYGTERFTWNPVNRSLSVEFPEENMARLFILTEN